MKSKRGQIPRRLALWLPVGGYVLLIFGLSSMSNPPAVQAAEHLDKVAHLVEYGVLGLLLGWAMGITSRRRMERIVIVSAIVVGACIGLADELYQGTVAGRERSLVDFLMDVAGVTAAQAVLFLWGRQRAGRGAEASTLSKESN